MIYKSILIYLSFFVLVLASVCIALYRRYLNIELHCLFYHWNLSAVVVMVTVPVSVCQCTSTVPVLVPVSVYSCTSMVTVTFLVLVCRFVLRFQQLHLHL